MEVMIEFSVALLNAVADFLRSEPMFYLFTISMFPGIPLRLPRTMLPFKYRQKVRLSNLVNAMTMQMRLQIVSKMVNRPIPLLAI